ncbi:16669_t:CDS:2, partial [Funneliformis geosporum]
TGGRKTAIKVVQDNNFETASDDLYLFHHKKEYIISTYSNGCGRAKSENNFVKKYPVKALEEGEEDLEEKEYMGGLIKIKISAEDDFTSSFLKLPGCEPIDICVFLKKRFSHSEVEKKGSLKFFLQKFGLDSKTDMPYDKMWKIYSEMKKSTSSSTMKKVASIAYVSLFDTHYCTNGMNVQNLLSACIMIERPVTGLDFASLYPSIIMAYNLSPEKSYLIEKSLIISVKIGTSFIRLSLNSISVTFKFDTLKLKARLVPLGKKRQHLKKIISSAKESGKRIPESLNLEYSFICFDYNSWNSKQKALKISL